MTAPGPLAELPRPCLGRNDVEVWITSLDALDAGEAGSTAVLSAREQARAATFRSADRRREFVLSHHLLREVVGHRLGIDPAGVEIEQVCARCGGPHGEPQLTRPRGGPRLSLAHEHGHVVVAVADAPVGVDIERVDSAPLALIDDVADDLMGWGLGSLMGAGPRAGSTTTDPWQIWTSYEAVVKLVGLAPTGAVRRPDRPIVVTTVEAPVGFVAGVATFDHPPSVRLRPWPPSSSPILER